MSGNRPVASAILVTGISLGSASAFAAVSAEEAKQTGTTLT